MVGLRRLRTKHRSGRKTRPNSRFAVLGSRAAAHMPGMTSFQKRQPRGVASGGQFASTAHAEPSLTLVPGTTTPGAFRRYTEDGMDQAEQRAISRRLVQGAYDSGLLRKMAGTQNSHDVPGVLASSRNDRKLDCAIDAVIERERNSPGSVRPDTLGFQLCRQLLHAQRAS